MTDPGAFTGPLFGDLIEWGVGGEVLGGVGVYALGEAYSYLVLQVTRQRILYVANLAVFQAAAFALTVAVAGHVLLPVLT